MTRSFPPAPTHASSVLLRAHPYGDSFNNALADAWAEGARERGLPVRVFDLYALDFDPLLRVAYKGHQPLEPDLVGVRDAIAAASHLTVAYPTWWGSTPAVLKGFFDRVFLPHWAFRYENHRPIPGLTGRAGRVLVTMDAPTWYDAIVYRTSSRQQVSRATLRFSGLAPVRSAAFGGIGSSTQAQRTKMLARARAVGEADGRRERGRFPTAQLERKTA